MKQKIKEALKQGHKNLGLSDEVFERVAASVETFITDESAIDGFVTSDSTLNLLKSYQSVNDKLRALEKKNVENPTPTDNGNPNPQPQPQPTPQPTETPDLVAQFSAMLDAKLSPLQEKINAFETEKAAQSAVDAAKAEFFEQAVVKAYQGVGNSAWRNTLRVFNSEGKKWSKDELLKALNDEFNTSCTEQNLDTTKPIQGTGDSDGKIDTSGILARLKERGKIVEEA